MEELRRREIVRSSNNPLGDFAELLFCLALGWTRSHAESKGFDALDNQGNRYQIKSRRLTNPSRQLGVIRELHDEQSPFDYLAAVLMTPEFQVQRAALVPLSIVRELATHVPRSNSWRFILRDNVWEKLGVRDVTDELRKAAQTI